jgi:diguanylate cyclase (GGDEF)-like protein
MPRSEASVEAARRELGQREAAAHETETPKRTGGRRRTRIDKDGSAARALTSRGVSSSAGHVADPRRTRSRGFESLLQATGAIAACRTVPDVADALRTEVTRVFDGSDRRIDVCLGQRGALRLYSGAGARKTDPDHVQPDAIAEKALRRRRPAWTGRDEPARLVVPLVSRNESWGYLDMRAPSQELPGRAEVAYLQLLANSAATVLENAYLRHTIGSQSMTDGVTGYYSGWYFHERLNSETARARRYGQPLSAIIFEVDDFEEFVEARGVAAGTCLLRAVSRLLKGSLRQKVDLPCRCGPARFALLLPNTPCSWDGAALVAERLRGTLEVTDFRTSDDEFLGRFTMSAGVAGFPSQCDDADELAAAAEEALREARRAGKNTVRVYRE